ncbi:hypothetical protein EYF80_035627 [Liparis tanakae]|uniref:Uncharacterized protein n=1 Tax=Liparis tanakae TaxID=230148 RepID=A0A4Z2GLK8_9TELE|nr:hypothetical protein EYF80_035627 [Liparis tanakae]
MAELLGSGELRWTGFVNNLHSRDPPLEVKNSSEYRHVRPTEALTAVPPNRVTVITDLLTHVDVDVDSEGCDRARPLPLSNCDPITSLAAAAKDVAGDAAVAHAVAHSEAAAAAQQSFWRHAGVSTGGTVELWRGRENT